MERRTIDLREDVYEALDAERRDDESFSDVLRRLLDAQRDEHPLRELVGTLDDQEAEELRAHAEEFRESLDEQMQRYW